MMMVCVTRAYFEYVKAPSDGTKFFSNLVSANSFSHGLSAIINSLKANTNKHQVNNSTSVYGNSVPTRAGNMGPDTRHGTI